MASSNLKNYVDKNGRWLPFLTLAKNERFDDIVTIIEEGKISNLKVWLYNPNDSSKSFDVCTTALHTLLQFHPTVAAVDALINCLIEIRDIEMINESRSDDGYVPEMEMDINGRTPLHIAAMEGCHISIVQRLVLHSKESVQVKDTFLRYPLHYACLNNNSQEDSDRRSSGDTLAAALVWMYPIAVSSPDHLGMTPMDITTQMQSSNSTLVRLFESLMVMGIDKLSLNGDVNRVNQRSLSQDNITGCNDTTSRTRLDRRSVSPISSSSRLRNEQKSGRKSLSPIRSPRHQQEQQQEQQQQQQQQRSRRNSLSPVRSILPNTTQMPSSNSTLVRLFENLMVMPKNGDVTRVNRQTTQSQDFITGWNDTTLQTRLDRQSVSAISSRSRLQIEQQSDRKSLSPIRSPRHHQQQQQRFRRNSLSPVRSLLNFSRKCKQSDPSIVEGDVITPVFPSKKKSSPNPSNLTTETFIGSTTSTSNNSSHENRIDYSTRSDLHGQDAVSKQYMERSSRSEGPPKKTVIKHPRSGALSSSPQFNITTTTSSGHFNHEHRDLLGLSNHSTSSVQQKNEVSIPALASSNDCHRALPNDNDIDMDPMIFGTKVRQETADSRNNKQSFGTSKVETPNLSQPDFHGNTTEEESLDGLHTLPTIFIRPDHNIEDDDCSSIGYFSVNMMMTVDRLSQQGLNGNNPLSNFQTDQGEKGELINQSPKSPNRLSPSNSQGPHATSGFLIDMERLEI